MGRAVALVTLLAACRLGFEDGGGTGSGSGSDGDNPVRSDAPFAMPPSDAGTCEPLACTTAGGTCVGAVCELIASGEDPLACPAGMPCRLVCTGYRYCRDGASCAGATWCEVACVGYRACQYGVACDTAQCDVTCNGEEACEAGITTAASCTSHCCGIETCGEGSGVANPCSNDETCG